MSDRSARERRIWPRVGIALFMLAAVLICTVVLNAMFFGRPPSAMEAPGSVARNDGAKPPGPVEPPDAAQRSSTKRPIAGQAIASLPPPGTRLSETYDQLKNRSDAGDAEAASRLYHDLHRCRLARAYQQIIDERLDREFPNESDSARLSAQEIKRREAALGSMQEQLDFVRDNEALCAGLGDERINSIVPASLRAAQLGDLKALDCYVGADLSMPGLLDHPEWLTQYKENLPGLMDAAMTHGDWVVVELKHHAYAGAFPGTPRGQLLGADPAMDYRYLRLERLGASGTFITKLDRMLNEASRQLTPRQVADGDSWAQEQYARYFAGSSSNEVSNGANTCQLADD